MDLFPNSRVRNIGWEGSDHCPVLLDTDPSCEDMGETDQVTKFELV